MMASSILQMFTAGRMRPSTQAPSQGAGQMRPVNSGKTLVARSRSSASFQWPLYTASFHSGMTLPRGQPVLGRVAEGGAAVHAARSLLVDLAVGERHVDRAEVLQPFRDRPVAHVLAGLIEEFAFSCHG